MIQGPEFLVGTKRHYLSMQESQHDIPWPLWQWQTYANEGECHSHYDPVTESLTPPTGPPSVSGKKKKEGSWKTGRYEQLPARRTGVTWLLCYLGFFAVLSALSWFPCFCNLFHWPICLAESFLFCVSLLCSGGRDRFTWAGFFEVKMPTAPRCSQSSSNQGLIPVIKIWEITLIHHSPSTPIG